MVIHNKIFRKKHARIFTPDAYSVVAGIINKIEDRELRQKVADHFCTEFNRRSRSFDPVMFGKLTGGRPAPNSACT